MVRIKIAAKQASDFLFSRYWILLVLAAPFLLFPSPLRSLIMLVIPLGWGMAWVATGKVIPRTPLNSVILLMELMVLVSLYATYDILVSLPKISGMVLGIGVFFAIVRESRRPVTWWISFMIFILTGLGIAGLGVLGVRWIAKIAFLTPIISFLPARLAGLPGAEKGIHPNEVAGALLWVLPLLITISVGGVFGRSHPQNSARSRFSGVIFALILASTFLILLVFILMQSRGGYIAFAITGWVLVAIILPGHRRWIFIVGTIITIILTGIVLLRFQNGDLLGGMVAFQLFASPATSLDTLQGRVEIWSRAIYGIQDFPFTGMGMNTFRNIVHVFYPLLYISPNFELGHAHNEFLQTALDLGLPGLVAFLALYFGSFWMLKECWRIVRVLKYAQPVIAIQLLPIRPDILMQAVVLGLGGGLLAHSIYGLTDAVALGAKPGVLFWMLLALITGLFIQMDNQEV